MFPSNATSMVELVPKIISNVATELVEATNLNSIEQARRSGRAVIIKRRNVLSDSLAKLANAYFEKAGLHIRFLVDASDWQRREIESYNLLNGDTFKARLLGDRGIVEDKLPGRSIWDHMKSGTLTRRMLVAAAKELRRAHRQKSAEFGDYWSHGDATATSAIYDEKRNRVRWIDFEIVHDKSLSTTARHAIDIRVFLMDMVGQLSLRRWLSFALCFVTAYGDRAVIAELRRRLTLPGGLAWVWWEVRSNFTAPARIKRRLATLRRAISKLEIYRAITARVRARHKWRPSIRCQATKPDTPRLSSRPRAMRDGANAVSPRISRRLPTKT
jgi:hypothetical protein